MRSEVILQDLVVLVAASRTSDRVDAELDALKSDLLEKNVNDADDLSIDSGAFASESLKAELVELTHSALLNVLISESSDVIEHPDR